MRLSLAATSSSLGLCAEQFEQFEQFGSTLARFDVIHKTGSTQHITTPPEEDRATAVCNVPKIGEDRTCRFEDMIADRQTHTETDRQTRSSQYSASLSGAE